jgi:hypothetical protein
VIARSAAGDKKILLNYRFAINLEPPTDSTGTSPVADVHHGVVGNPEAPAQIDSPAPNPLDEVRAAVGDVDVTTASILDVVRPYTMTSGQRVVALCDAIRYVSARGIAGDIVECGVWRGGSMLAAARTLVACDDVKRTLWLYDTFSGMTPPSDLDRRAVDSIPAATLLSAHDRTEDIWAVADLEDVRSTMSLSAYPDDRIRYVIGPVAQTIPDAAPAEIAVLRLDTDWYESTRHELVHLFPRLSPGGVLIIDDYGYWDGARKAVDEYLASIEIPVLLTRIDQTGRMAVVPGRTAST